MLFSFFCFAIETTKKYRCHEFGRMTENLRAGGRYEKNPGITQF